MKFIVLVFFIANAKLVAAQNAIRIGSQVWMASNLDTDRFRNGDRIPQARSRAEWISYANAGEPAWCYYDNDPTSGYRYGKLYNWYAVNDSRGLAPEGWHIPALSEWAKLAGHLGGLSYAGEEMKSERGWDKSGNGTNRSGWSGLPGGKRSAAGDFDFLGLGGYWWSATEYIDGKAWYIALRYEDGRVSRRNYDKRNGFSVRCLRD